MHHIACMTTHKHNIKNPFTDTIDYTKAKVLGAGVLLQPVLKSDFPESQGLALPAHLATKQNDIILFRVLKVGPLVHSVAPQQYVIPSTAACDVIATDASVLLVEEQDIRLVFNEGDLQ